MFTGIVEEVGKVTGITAIDGGIRITIEASAVLEDTKQGDSINVNGACQTVISQTDTSFTVEAVGETLTKTNLGQLTVEQTVNLERPLTMSSRLGGHFVQGHVNCTGTITQWFARGDNWFLQVELPVELRPYTIPEGSITIDGISLTIADLQQNLVGVNIIPHTAQHTNLAKRNIGETVNIEVDMIAKYIENMIKYSNNLTESGSKH
ncbi:MAG: riboflavin synthase [Calditrichia bacterium]